MDLTFAEPDQLESSPFDKSPINTSTSCSAGVLNSDR